MLPVHTSKLHSCNLWLRAPSRGRVMTLLPSLAAPLRLFGASSAPTWIRGTRECKGGNRDPFICIRAADGAVPNKFAVYTSAPPSNIHVSFLCFSHLRYARLSQACALSLICQFQEHLAGPRQSKTHPALRVRNFRFLPFSDTNMKVDHMADGKQKLIVMGFFSSCHYIQIYWT